MKLYYAPGACSLAPHITLEELGLSYEAIPVDLRTKTYPGGDYGKVNPKGAVPALELDDGEVLTETAVILQYLSDQKPAVPLLPSAGMERYRTLEWLNYIATELHKGFAPLWYPNSPEETKSRAKELLAKRFGYVSSRLSSGEFLMGTQFTVADPYLLVMLGWAKHHRIDLTPWPALLGFSERLRARPAVVKAMKAEGLLK